MTAFQWAIDLAKELIDRNGEPVVMKVFTTVVPDANFPNETTDSSELVINARAAFLNYSGKEAGKAYADGTEIHRSDKKVLVAAKGLVAEPNMQGELTRASGAKYRIVSVKGLDPDGASIYFEVQARK